MSYIIYLKYVVTVIKTLLMQKQTFNKLVITVFVIVKTLIAVKNLKPIYFIHYFSSFKVLQN